MSIFSFQSHPDEVTLARMSMPTCVTMPNGVIAMFPDAETARRAYHEAYPSVGAKSQNNGFCDQSRWLKNKTQDPRVGALTSTRTMEYVDLRGAPWAIVLTSEELGGAETASSNSIAYRSGKTTIEQTVSGSSALESAIRAIDAFVEDHSRDSLEASNLTHYPQTPFSDSNGNKWTVEWITKEGKGHLGYFAFESDVVVGLAVSKVALKAMVEKYLARLDSEKSTASYAITDPASPTSLVYGVDATRTMSVPPGVPSDGGAGHATNWGNVAIFTGAFALVSYLAYAVWTNLGAP